MVASSASSVVSLGAMVPLVFRIMAAGVAVNEAVGSL